MGEGISGDAGLAAAPYDQWVLLSPAGGSPRPPARYKVRHERFLPCCCCCYTYYCIHSIDFLVTITVAGGDLAVIP